MDIIERLRPALDRITRYAKNLVMGAISLEDRGETYRQMELDLEQIREYVARACGNQWLSESMQSFTFPACVDRALRWKQEDIDILNRKIKFLGDYATKLEAYIKDSDDYRNWAEPDEPVAEFVARTSDMKGDGDATNPL